MTHFKLGCLKCCLRLRSSNASSGRAARMPVPPQDASSSAANVSQGSPSSTHPGNPNYLADQPQATGSSPSAAPGQAPSSAATLALRPAQTTVSQTQAGLSLWDRAYEALRADDPDLLDCYEKLLSKEIPESITTTTTSQNTSGQVGSLELPENRINSDSRARQDQLKEITNRGMEQADGKQTKYTIFGHKFFLKDQVSQAAQFIKAVKGIVDEAVKVSPEASLAWAGVCVLLPVFTIPSAAEEANRDGLSYVTSRLCYYVELERLLWPENIESKDLRGEVEGHIVELYQKLLEFQIKTVIRFYSRWITNVGQDVRGSDDWKGMVTKIKVLEQIVQDESSSVNTIAARKRLGDIHDAAKQQDDKLQSLLSVAKESLLVSKEHKEISSKQLAEHQRTNQILEDRPTDLPIVYEACYDSADVQDSPKCEGDTRSRIRDNIDQWAEEDSDEILLWLVGPAGTGKSTIARTVADSFARKERLAAGYFFKRGEQGRNGTNRLFPTLAFQMTDTIPPFRRYLGKSLDGLDKDAVEKKALEFQFDRLLRRPLAELPLPATKRLPMVIIIDALDECERPEHLSGILSLLSELRNNTRVRLRVMLTSRSAPSIADAFDPFLENKTARRLEIHREFFEDTKKDIRTFLDAKFADIRKKRRLQQNPWPSAEDMDRLVQLATSPEPLFIYAATLCRFVYDQNKLQDPKKQLHLWLEQCEGNKSQLGQMYSPILAQLFAGKSKADSDEQLRFLGALVLVANPLSASSLTALLAFKMDDVNWWLHELHAVLDIPSESHKPLRLLHKSFSDFLLDSDGPNANMYRVDVAATHSMLTEKCVQRMESGLKQDICDIQELDATRDEIDEDEIAGCIPADLKYACLHWIYHLQCSGQPPGTYVQNFFHEHFLHWLEALSLLGRLSDGAFAIRQLLELIKRFPDTPLEFVDLVKDAKRVIPSFGSIIERAPLQAYGALLFFAPIASKVRQTFWNQRMPRLDPIQGVESEWDACLQTLEGHTSYIRAIAFSPDSQVIASGSDDDTVRLWSATTGAHLHTLEGHGGAVHIVVFSDNETLATGSRDRTVRIWNLPTGKLLHTLNDNQGRIEAVVFLPDGEHLASASTTKNGVSVRLWDLKTDTPPKELFQDYKNAFRQVDFSPDSQLMASGLSDNTIEIWNFPTGPRRCRLEGHSSSTVTMVFSQSNQLLASGSVDKTIRLWNIEDGVQIYALRNRFRLAYEAIALSPDGRLLASAGPERNIRIWNVASGTPQETHPGHQSFVTTVAFSPDSQLLASASLDRTIKLWDPEMHSHSQHVDRHSDHITTVNFSPDGQLVVTGSRDGTVRLWDVSTGVFLKALSTHSDWVNDVIFSPDGKLLASFDDSVRIWNMENGTVQQRYDTQSGLITAVDYSADGQRAASASFNTITLYNAAPGVDLLTLEGHSDFIEQVVFSPDCQFLASSSHDKTIRLWETISGTLRNTLRYADFPGKLVFSPNSQLLASASNGSLVLWNVISGSKQQTLEVEGIVKDIIISPDNQLLAIQAWLFNGQQAINLRDMETDNSWHTLKNLDIYATGIVFSPNGQIIAVAMKDRTVCLWNARTHKHLLTVENPDGSVTKLKFSPDGETLATASRDKTIRLWNTTTGFQIQMLQYGTGFVREINFLPEELVVSTSSGEYAWSWNLDWIPKTLKTQKFRLTAASQSSKPEPNVPGINLDWGWITKDSEGIIWLPPEYRPTSSRSSRAWARTGSTIFIGCDSGRLLRVQDI